MMKDKYLQGIFEQIEIPDEDIRNSIREGIHRAEIKVKKKNHILRILPAAAVLLLTAVMTLSFSFPSFAEKIPVIGDIFKMFEDKEKKFIFEEYDSHSTKLDITKESNGISIHLTEAVYDGENITLAYTMNSEQDLGAEPFIEWDWSLFDNLYGEKRASHITKKIGENKYAGLVMISIMNGNRPDTIQFTWKGESIGTFERENRTQGNWSFDLTLDNIGSEMHKFKNMISKGEGMEVELKNMTSTPISTSFYFNEKVGMNLREWEESKWAIVYFDYEMEDNLGNSYTMVTNGSYGGNVEKIGRAITTTIEEDATSIFITPIITIYQEKSEQKEGEYGVELELARPPFKLEPIEVPVQSGS